MDFKLNHQALSSPPELETERLVLKPVSEKFRPLIFEYLSDRDVRHHMKMPVLDTSEKQGKWWNRFAEWRAQGKAVQWCGFLKETGEYAGLFTLKEIDTRNARGEVGYSILYTHWGRGLTGEGVKRMVDFAFGEADLHSLFAMILPYNIPSQRIVKRLGFEQEAHLRQIHFYEGRFYDVLQFSKINPAHEA